jgi:nudix motif 8
MVDEGIDQTIIETSLREMFEEIGITPDEVDVLGILRCNWTEVASITGVPVTPVVGYVGELESLNLSPNPSEVDECFTVPIKDLLNRDLWVIRDFSAPVFTGGPFVIWGLTAYLLDRFLQDVLLKVGIVN